MFPIAWRFIVGVILGAVIVKESRWASEFYDSARKKIVETARRGNASWSGRGCSKGSEGVDTCAVSSAPGA